MKLPTKDDIDGGSAFIRLALAIALCASLSACTGQQVQSAGTIAAALNGLGMANFRIYEQYRLGSGEITQDEFNHHMAAANALNSVADLNIMTAREIEAALAKPETSQ